MPQPCTPDRQFLIPIIKRNLKVPKILNAMLGWLLACLPACLLACFSGTKHEKSSKMEMSSEILWSIYLHWCTGMHMHMPIIPTYLLPRSDSSPSRSEQFHHTVSSWPGSKIKCACMRALVGMYICMYVTTRNLYPRRQCIHH